MSALTLVTYTPAYAAEFATLNYAWIEAYFAIEAEDRAALEAPQAYALDAGGEIFFLLEAGVPVGTVAMVPFKGNSNGKAFELAKMAVREDRRGRGYGQHLMRACLDFARTQSADEIVLITNDVLEPALRLCRRWGFVAMPANTDTRYARGNLEMRLALNAPSSAGADTEI